MGLLKDFMTYVNKYLVSENGQKFKFAFDEATQKYGYIVTDSAGADTFHPFREEEEAEEDTSFSVYPNDSILWNNTIWNGVVNVNVEDSAETKVFTSGTIDVTSFSKLVWNLSVNRNFPEGNAYGSIYVKALYEGTQIYYENISVANGIRDFNLTVDLENITGTITLEVFCNVEGTGSATITTSSIILYESAEDTGKYKTLIGSNFSAHISNNAKVELAESTKHGHVLIKGSNPDSALAVVYYDSDYFDLDKYRYIKFSGVCNAPWYAYVKLQKEGAIGYTTLLELKQVTGGTFNKFLDLQAHSGMNRISLQLHIKDSTAISSMELFELTLER